MLKDNIHFLDASFKMNYGGPQERKEHYVQINQLLHGQRPTHPSFEQQECLKKKAEVLKAADVLDNESANIIGLEAINPKMNTDTVVLQSLDVTGASHEAKQQPVIDDVQACVSCGADVMPSGLTAYILTFITQWLMPSHPETAC